MFRFRCSNTLDLPEKKIQVKYGVKHRTDEERYSNGGDAIFRTEEDKHQHQQGNLQ